MWLTFACTYGSFEPSQNIASALQAVQGYNINVFDSPHALVWTSRVEMVGPYLYYSFLDLCLTHWMTLAKFRDLRKSSRLLLTYICYICFLFRNLPVVQDEFTYILCYSWNNSASLHHHNTMSNQLNVMASMVSDDNRHVIIFMHGVQWMRRSECCSHSQLSPVFIFCIFYLSRIYYIFIVSYMDVGNWINPFSPDFSF